MRLPFFDGEAAQRRRPEAATQFLIRYIPVLLLIALVTAGTFSAGEEPKLATAEARTVVTRASREKTTTTFDIEAAKAELLDLQTKRRALEAQAADLREFAKQENIPVQPPDPPSDMRGAILECIRSYEGGYNTDTGNGFFWAYQFDHDTWDGATSRIGHPEYVGWAVRGHQPPPPDIQDQAAWQLYNERGLQPWPTPNRYCHPPNPVPKWANPAYH